MKLIRPVILLALVVLAPSASAAVGETAASAAVLEEETVAATSGTQLSPDVAIDPSDAATRVLVADTFPSGVGSPPNGSNPRTAAWRRSGSSWNSVTVPLPAGSGADNRGRPSVAWGQGSQVWVAQRGRYDPAYCSANSGAFVSRSTNGGATFSTGELVIANEPTFTSANSPAFSVNELDIVPDPASQRAFVVADVTTFGADDCDDPATGSRILVASPWQPGDGPAVATLSVDGHSPSAVALTGAGPQLAIAFVNADGDVGVVQCTNFAVVVWSCALVEVIPVDSPQPRANGSQPIALDPAPSLARGADGRLHLAYTAQAGADTDVLYQSSGDSGATWTPPVSVADPGAAAADQFLGTVSTSPTATPGSAAGRVEVAFLDRRDNGVGFRPFSTSFQTFDGDATPSRGSNRALDTVVHSAPVHNGTSSVIADVGTRLAVAVTPADASAPSGPGLFWWPSTSAGSASDVVATRLNHGTTEPSLSSGQIITSKNVAVGVGDLLVAPDDDGDPVRVSITTPPAHGALAGSLFVPAAGYAGPDVVGVRASDGVRSDNVTRLITVSNSTPVLPDAMLVSVPQGGTAQLQLGATDADVNEALTYGLDGDPPSLLAGGVSVTADGLVTIAAPPGARSPAIVDVRVRVTDTSPSPTGVPTGTAVARIPVKIVPVYRAVGVSVVVRRSGRVVGFSTTYVDDDPERGRHVPVYQWDFGDGSKGPDNTKANPNHAYKPGQRYTWRLTLTMPRDDGQSEPVTLSKTIDVPQSGASLLTVKQRIDRRRGRLLVSLRPKFTGRVTVRLKAGGATATPQTINVKKGVWRSVPLALAPLQGARTADLSIHFLQTAGLSGPEPTPYTRKIRLR